MRVWQCQFQCQDALVYRVYLHIMLGKEYKTKQNSSHRRAILQTEKFVGSFGGNFQKLSPNFSEVACMEITRRNVFWGNFLESCFRTPGTSQKLPPEVRPAVHMTSRRLRE